MTCPDPAGPLVVELSATVVLAEGNENPALLTALNLEDLTAIVIATG
jgi:hypothetical protein